MEVLSTLLTSLAGLADLATAHPAVSDYFSGALSVPSHTPHVIFSSRLDAAIEREAPATRTCTGIDPLHPPTTLFLVPTATQKRSLTTSDPFASPGSTTRYTSSPNTPVWHSYTTSTSSNGWRSAPTSTPVVETCGFFKPNVDTPDAYITEIKVPLGVCQRADEGKGVPTWASFVNIIGSHWCGFFNVHNGCNQTDPERKYGPFLNYNIAKYQGQDYR
ncbi:hypothetical protein PMIN03_006044 [Paraphaeosphaeria minitans]